MRFNCPQLLAGFMLLFLPCLVGADTTSAYEEQLRFADGLYARSMYRLAIPEYEALLERFPSGVKNDAALFRLAESFRLSGDMETSVPLYDRLVARFKDSDYWLRAAYRRARLYMESGDYAAVVEHFRAILSEAPDAEVAAACQFYLGDALLANDALDDAEAAFNALQEKHPDSPFVPYARIQQAKLARNRQKTAAEQADSQKAESFAKQALALYDKVLADRNVPSRLAAEALFQSADTYYASGDYTRAAVLYQRLLNEHPDDERATESRLQAAWSAVQSGLFSQALTLAAQAIPETTGEAHAEWLYLKANSERQLMQYEKATATYQQLLAFEGTHSYRDRARYELALSFFKQERYASAIREALPLTHAGEHQKEVAWLLAESHAALDQIPESIQYYQLVLRVAPDSDIAPTATYRLAYQLQSQGNTREAARTYSMIVDRFPQHALAAQSLYAAAVCYENAQDDLAAVRDYNRLIADYADSQYHEEALFRKALAEIRAGLNREASESLTRYRNHYRKGRFTAEIAYWHAVLLADQERFEDARKMLDQAVIKKLRPELQQEAYLLLGKAHQKVKDEAAAAQAFEQLIGTDAETRLNPELLEWLATYWLNADKPEASLQAASALRRRHANPAWQQAAWTLSGHVHDKQNRPDEARTAYKNALQENASTRYGAEAALKLANAFLEAGSIAEARNHFEEASRRATSDALMGIRMRALYGLGRCHEADGQPEAAARAYMSVAILFNDPEIVPESLKRASDMFTRAGAQEDAERARQELLERYPETSSNK